MQISEHFSELGRWRVVWRDADPRLRAYVHGYLASEGYLPRSLRERHLPCAEVAILVNFGSPHRMLDASNPNRSTNYRSAWVVGLHDHYQLSEAVGERRFMVIRFTPVGAHLFLRLPMELLATRVVELEEIDVRTARLVLARLHVASDWKTRFDMMDALIAERVASAHPPSAGLLWAWQRLQETWGATDIGMLAAALGCSRRHLIGQFRRYMGLPPKTVARILRFNRAVRLMNRVGRNMDNDPESRPYLDGRWTGSSSEMDVRWAEVALDSGYYDQSHFIKEFRAFAGVTPVEFLRQLLPDDSKLCG